MNVCLNLQTLLCVYKFQAEKKLKVQLTTLEQQHLKAQGALKEKEKELEKLQAQLKMSQGSFEEETKKLEGQVAKLQEVNVKKASNIFKIHIQTCILLTTVIVLHHIATLPII